MIFSFPFYSPVMLPCCTPTEHSVSLERARKILRFTASLLEAEVRKLLQKDDEVANKPTRFKIQSVTVTVSKKQNN